MTRLDQTSARIGRAERIIAALEKSIEQAERDAKDAADKRDGLRERLAHARRRIAEATRWQRQSENLGRLGHSSATAKARKMLDDRIADALSAAEL